MSKNYKLLSMKKKAEILNNMTYSDYYYRLMMLARSAFEWKGLPNGMDEAWIERFLFNEGSCVFFKDSNLGFVVMQYNTYGSLNNYCEPTRVKPHAINYTGEPLDNYTECVIIQNNDAMLPTAPTIEMYAYQLAEITRASIVNIKANKTPVLITCNEKQRLTLKQVYNQFDGNFHVIFGDKNLDVEGIKVLKTDAPVVFDKLRLEKHAVWNECMTFLGLNNANQDKKERLVTDEVKANNAQVEQSALVMLKSRELACKRINELFDLNISVRLRTRSEVQNEDELGVVV